MNDPRITDDDCDEITATVNGKVVRVWSYKDDAERRMKMRMAHEFAEGWFQHASLHTANASHRPFHPAGDEAVTTFVDYRDLPEPVRTQLMTLEIFICDTEAGEFEDDGTIDADDVVVAFNEIVAALRAAPATPKRGEK